MNNYTSEIGLITDRLKKLNSKPFDWVAWKKGTLLVIKSIFGEESAYFNQLNNTDYEYSSWSLRDTSGSGDPVKSSCAELLEICLIDLQSRQQHKTQSASEKITKVLENYFPTPLKTDILSIANSELPNFEKSEKLIKTLNQIDKNTTTKVLVDLIVELMKNAD